MKSPYKVGSARDTAATATSPNGRPRRRWMLSLLIVPMVAGLGVLSACSGSDSGVGQPAAAESATATLARVSPTEGQALLDAGALLIDVRTPQEYQQVRLDEAALIDVSAADFDARISELDRNAAYVIYCRTGNRSAVAADRMAKLGFTEVYDMGGIDVWMNEGRPVVSG